MLRLSRGLGLTLCVACAAFGFEEPEGLRDRFLRKMKTELGKLPDFVCAQTVDRFSRSHSEQPWNKIDTLGFEVALVGDQELYALPGERQYRPLAAMIDRGSITSGQLGTFAKHVFLTSKTQLSYRGESEREGRRVHEYEYDVEASNSSYRLHSGRAEAATAFQGAFWVDAETLDLAKLDVQAYDIPERLGLAEVNTSLMYQRVTIDAVPVLLPTAATLFVAALNGGENLNRTRLSGCRHYSSESTIRFETGAPAGESDRTAVAPVEAAVEPAGIPVGAVLELSLESVLDPATASVGDVVGATVARPVKDGDRTLVPQGASVLGRLVRVHRQTTPFPTYEFGLQLDSLELGGRRRPLTATMEDAGPVPGLLRQSKHLDPKFTRRRGARLDVLVQEVRRGQGILMWDPRHGVIPRGLRMKWRVERD